MATLTGTQQNAYEMLVKLFKTFGLDTLAPEILKLVQKGINDAPTVELMLQDTPAWKQRFAGNELRRKAGLDVYDPKTYLDLEDRFGSTLRQYGIPAGMYGRSDFADWIGKNISPVEIEGRVQMAAQAQYNADKSFSDALHMFGVDKGHQIAYFLDENKALPFLQRQFQASLIGSSALRHNLNLNPQVAQALAAIGVTADQAESGYGQIAENLPALDKLAHIEGGSFTQGQAEQATFFGDAEARRRAQQLAGTEAARFGGSTGLDTRDGLSRSLQGAY